MRYNSENIMEEIQETKLNIQTQIQELRDHLTNVDTKHKTPFKQLKSVKDTLNAVQAQVTCLRSRLNEAEERISELEDKITKFCKFKAVGEK